mmetsp:Transcript_83282/g.258583  ORF Transcript_83282/g.258583 Transcript_83282/m.258583 type:complete len:249 (+) Transcript_83282:458-1204(+)
MEDAVLDLGHRDQVRELLDGEAAVFVGVGDVESILERVDKVGEPLVLILLLAGGAHGVDVLRDDAGEERNHGEGRHEGVRDEEQVHRVAPFPNQPADVRPVVEGHHLEHRDHAPQERPEHQVDLVCVLLRALRRAPVLRPLAHDGGADDSGHEDHRDEQHGDPEHGLHGCQESLHQQVQLLEVPDHAAGPQHPEHPQRGRSIRALLRCSDPLPRKASVTPVSMRPVTTMSRSNKFQPRSCGFVKKLRP